MMNVFTKKVKPKGRAHKQPDIPAARARGRPRGRTEKGLQSREHLYETATRLIAERGYESTTLREIAAEAGVSLGLLYRYFPSKRAVVLGMYDELTETFARRASQMTEGSWTQRFSYALRASVAVLSRQRAALVALTPVLIGDREEGVLAAGTSASRERVRAVFLAAVSGASDAPEPDLAAALGRLLYTAHLGIVLWWLLDKSPRQSATRQLLDQLDLLLPLAASMLSLPPAQLLIHSADQLCMEALFGTHP
jgi:AcrR family transcriptional regulator